MFESVGGVETAYKLLLGSKVFNSLYKNVGKEQAHKFLVLHAKYDALVRKNPKADPLNAMEAHDIPAFNDFDAYLYFLRSIERQLSIMKEPISKALYETVSAMVRIGEAKTAVSAVTSAPVIPAHDILKGKTLPDVPLYSSNLPYSYPSFDATLDVVKKFVDEKNYEHRIRAELTSALKTGLVKTLDGIRRSDKATDKTVPELVVEAQCYLMDHGWIRYGINNVAKASFNIARAGIRHEVTTAGLIRHLETSRTLAYTTIGLELETILRRAVFVIVKDVSTNMVFAGHEAGFDVLVAASSWYVQELARNWLDEVQTLVK